MSILDAQNTIVAVGEGHPGATRVLVEVRRDFGEDTFLAVIHGLRHMGFSGSSVWICYKDYAGEDLRLFADAVKGRDEDMQKLVGLMEMRR